jgi:hypothetical protein
MVTINDLRQAWINASGEVSAAIRHLETLSSGEHVRISGGPELAIEEWLQMLRRFQVEYESLLAKYPALKH